MKRPAMNGMVKARDRPMQLGSCGTQVRPRTDVFIVLPNRAYPRLGCPVAHHHTVSVPLAVSAALPTISTIPPGAS